MQLFVQLKKHDQQAAIKLFHAWRNSVCAPEARMTVLYAESRVQYCDRRPGAFSGSYPDHFHTHSQQFTFRITTASASTVTIQRTVGPLRFTLSWSFYKNHRFWSIDWREGLNRVRFLWHCFALGIFHDDFSTVELRMKYDKDDNEWSMNIMSKEAIIFYLKHRSGEREEYLGSVSYHIV